MQGDLLTGFIAGPSAAPDDGPGLRGKLLSIEAVRRYVEGGNAILTIRSMRTQDRFTFKFVRPKVGRAPDQPNMSSLQQRPIWVRLLTDSSNEGRYEFLGTIWQELDGSYRYCHSHRKSRIKEDAPSAQAAAWVARCVGYRSRQLIDQAEVWHEGRCGRCGRRLTVPESVSSGFGPECIQLIAQ